MRNCKQVRWDKRKGKGTLGLDAGEVSCGHMVRVLCVHRGEDTSDHVNAVVSAELAYHSSLPELVASGCPTPDKRHGKTEESLTLISQSCQEKNIRKIPIVGYPTKY